MYKLAHGLAAVAVLAAGLGAAGQSSAGATGRLPCQLTNQNQIDNYAYVLTFTNTSGQTIPARATVEVSFRPYNFLVSPAKASIPVRHVVPVNGVEYLINPFASPHLRPDQSVVCDAYAHWTDFRPDTTRRF